VFLNSKKLLAKKTTAGVRYYKKIGLGKFKPQSRKMNECGIGFKTPSEAIEGQYVDKKCPFTSNVSIRGRIFK